MHLIEDEEFFEICQELDRLKEQEKDLEKGYINLKLENIKISNYSNYRAVLIFVLIVIVFLLLTYLYKKQIEFTAVNEQKYKLEKAIDSIGKAIKTTKDEKDIFLITEKRNEIIFSVQIGVFRNFKLPNKSFKLAGGIRKLPNGLRDRIDKYIVGAFYTYEDASIFRDEIKKIGIKDAFLVALHKGKKIHISKAIKILKN